MSTRHTGRIDIIGSWAVTQLADCAVAEGSRAMAGWLACCLTCARMSTRMSGLLSASCTAGGREETHDIQAIITLTSVRRLRHACLPALHPGRLAGALHDIVLTLRCWLMRSAKPGFCETA